MIVVFLLSALPKARDTDSEEEEETVKVRVDKHAPALRTVLKALDSHSPSMYGDTRDSIVSYSAEQWAGCLHEDASDFAPFLAGMGQLFQVDYAIAQPAPDAYNLHEAMQRLLLQEIWRLKGLDDTFPLDTAQRDYHFDPSMPSATGLNSYLKRSVDSESRERALFLYHS